MTRDLRYALRHLRRRPGFTLVVLLTLGVGIGATTAVFSVVNGVLLRPLPYPDAGEIYTLWEEPEPGGRSWVSAPNFRDWRESLGSFGEIAALTPSGFNVSAEGGPERVQGVEVTPGFFRVLGVPPAAGRGFLAGEGRTPAARVAVISHGLWQRQYGGSSDAVGATLRLEGLPYEVVGVLPAGSAYPSDSDVWVPVDLAGAEWKEGRGTKWLQVIGRLRPGVTIDAARREMAVVASNLARAYPETNAGAGVRAVALPDELVGDVRTPLLVVAGAVALVLLVVCVNVAGLFLARAARRRREMAIRRSLGGSRGRLLRQLLTESLTLSLLGGGLGVLVAEGAVQALRGLAPAGTPRLDQVALDPVVLAFALAVSVAAGLLSGTFPAIRESRVDPREGLRADEAGRGAGSRSRLGLRGGLVVTQVALAVVLVVGAGHLLQTFRNLRAVDPGFRPERVLTVWLPLTEPRYESDEAVAGFYGPLVQRVRDLPGVDEAGVVSVLPFGGNQVNFSFELRDPAGLAPDDLVAGYQSASAGYFRALGIPVLRGRAFREGEGSGDEPVVIVDETFAERFFPDGDALGREIYAVGDVWRRVVGVVGAVRRMGPRSEPAPMFYVPLRQDPRDAMTLLVRAERGDPLRLLGSVRSAVRSLDPDQPLVAPAAMETYVARALTGPRFTMAVLGSFGGVTLLLAALGIFGVLSQAVGSRTREIGIRMALGARARKVRTMVVRQGLTLALLGLALGVVAALPGLRLLRGLLFGVSAFEPAVVGAAIALLAFVALWASYVPARRATRVDPMVVLKEE